jgi:RNA polymerase sigma-70 factor (ECF subfamily)
MELAITTSLADGDHHEALRLMARAWADPVKRFCVGLVGSEADAEELVQEAFIEALQAMPRYRADAGPRAWLFGIARRVCIRHLRRRDRRAGLLSRWWTPPPAAAPEADRADANRLLGDALAALKPHLREAVLLSYQIGLDGPELADALAVRPATARKRLSLGIQALRETLRPLLMDPQSPLGRPSALDPPATAEEPSDDDPSHPVPLPARPQPRLVGP